MIRLNFHKVSSTYRRTAFKILHSRLVVGVVALSLAIPLTMHAADSRPVKLRVPPIYPELAKRLRVSGVVRVSATVAPDGKVTATKTVSGNQMLATAAEEAVSRWKFAPAETESTVEVDVNFALGQ